MIRIKSIESYQSNHWSYESHHINIVKPYAVYRIPYPVYRASQTTVCQAAELIVHRSPLSHDQLRARRSRLAPARKTWDAASGLNMCKSVIKHQSYKDQTYSVATLCTRLCWLIWIWFDCQLDWNVTSTVNHQLSVDWISNSKYQFDLESKKAGNEFFSEDFFGQWIAINYEFWVWVSLWVKRTLTP